MSIRQIAALTATFAVALTACASDPVPTADASLQPLATESAPASPSASPVASPSPTPVATPTEAASVPVAALSWTDAPSGSIAMPDGAFLIGMSPDGEHLLVQAPHPDGRGCEEGPPYALQLLDIDGGDLRLAADPALGVNLVERTGTDGALLAAGCEGFIFQAWQASVAASGELEDVTEIPLPMSGEGYETTNAIAAIPDSDDVLLAIFDPEVALLRIAADGTTVAGPDPIPSEVYELVSSGLGAFGVLYGGAVGGEVTELRSGIGLAGYEQVVRSMSGARTMVAGDSGVALLTSEPDAGPGIDEWIADPAADDVIWGGLLPTGEDQVFAIRDVTGVSELVLLDADGIVESIDLGVSPYEGPLVSDDGLRLVYVVEDPVTFDRTVVVRNLL